MKKNRQQTLILTIPRADAEITLDKQIQLGNEILNVSIETNTQLKAAEKRYNHWNSDNFEFLKKILKKQEIAKDYSSSPWSIGKILIGDLKLSVKIENLKTNIKRKLTNMESIKTSLEYLGSELDTDSESSNKVFFIHGTDCETKHKVLEYLLKLGLQPIILKDMASAGKTVMDVIGQREDVKYAIALLTPDDVGSIYNEKLNFRASQNVILELGIFVGKLGRNKVSSLYTESVELPEDYHEFQHIQITRSDKWKSVLRAELQIAGFILEID